MKCAFHEQGCTWTGTIVDASKHSQQCHIHQDKAQQEAEICAAVGVKAAKLKKQVQLVQTGKLDLEARLDDLQHILRDHGE